MKPEISQAFARLRSALYNPSKYRMPGKCVVLQADLEQLLAEVEQLSNMQMAKYLLKEVFAEFKKDEQRAEGKKDRAVEGRRRRNHPFHRATRSTITGRSPALDGVFVFTDEGMTVEAMQ